MKYLISEEKRTELEQRLEYLLTVRKKEVEEFTAGTGAMESFHQAGSAEDIKQSYYKEIRELQTVLDNCEVLDKSKIDTSSVNLGVTVKLIGENGESLVLQLVSEIEVDPATGKVSSDSPVGSLINGKKLGEEVILPKGKFKIVSIS